MKLSRALRRLRIEGVYKWLDRRFLPRDKAHVRRARNILLIPEEAQRRGGKYSYAEWAHVIGIFQTLMGLRLPSLAGNQVLDIGCGTGLLGIAAAPFLSGGGRYLGLDVMTADIEFCRAHYPSPPFEFVHFDVNNPSYAPNQTHQQQPWPVEDAAFDLLTALSVWTHLSETDARFYIREVARALRPGALAIITLFLLDEDYEKSLPLRTDAPGRFHRTPQTHWVFDQPAYGSSMWFCPKRVKHPEDAIGMTRAGLDLLLAESGLELAALHPGNWKEAPGLYFQDILILRKPQ